MEEKNIKYTYIRDLDDDNRVLTIARRWGKNGNKIHYGYALCRPDTDQFRKDIGRTIASGRMSEKPSKVLVEQKDRVLRSVMLDILENNTTPKIVRKIAKEWLYVEFLSENVSENRYISE